MPPIVDEQSDTGPQAVGRTGSDGEDERAEQSAVRIARQDRVIRARRDEVGPRAPGDPERTRRQRNGNSYTDGIRRPAPLGSGEESRLDVGADGLVQRNIRGRIG